jgi:hypothetical protein
LIVGSVACVISGTVNLANFLAAGIFMGVGGDRLYPLAGLTETYPLAGL